MAQALEGIRVLDFAQGFTAVGTMVLADYGAEVIRVEPAGGDSGWDHPSYLLWNRGKKSIDLDLRTADGKAAVRKLAQSVDILFENFRPSEADGMGIGYKELSALNPALIYVSVTGFGPSGPYSHLKSYDGIVMAKAGRMKEQVGWIKGRPTYRAIQDATYAAALMGVQGALAALRVRSITGKGQKVDTSALAGTTNLTSPWLVRQNETLAPEPPLGPVGPRTESGSISLMECKDGRWIQFTSLQMNLFKAQMTTMGFDWIWEDPRFKGAPNSFPDEATRAEFNRQVIARMEEKTAQEWMDIFVANGDVSAEAEETTQDCLRHPQFMNNGHQITIDDPRVGKMIQVGAIAKMSDTPAVIKDPAPKPGQHTKEVLGSLNGHKPSARPTGKSLKHPLEGVTILDLSTYYAAPFGATLMADLGARVIKIEPLTGDSYRAMSTNDSMLKAIHGKESIAVDLKTPEGKEIIQKLASKADMLMHNMRPGVPERLGFGYETLRKINPRLVYIYAGSYGSTGPHSHRPAFNPTMGAISGLAVFQSGEGNNPMGDAPTGAPDPIAAVTVGTAFMVGLTARDRTGKGQYVETTMMNSNVLCVSDDAFDFAGKPPRRMPDKAQLGLEATYRLYETKVGWVFFAAPKNDEFQAFCKVMGREDLSKDARFATGLKRYANRAALSTVLEPVFKTKTAEEWESTLTAKDVACVKADGVGHKWFLHTDPHVRATNFMVQSEHPSLGGKYLRVGPRVLFSETPSQIKPYSDLGEYTRPILKELGYSEPQIDGMKESGVVSWPGGAGKLTTATR